MKVLITGASGTIGTRLCETLLSQGHSVVGIDRVKNVWKPEVDAITKQADLLSTQALEGVDTDFDAIVHLAANARVYDLVEEPVGALENMQTTFNVLEWARQAGIPRVIFSSSRETYGNLDKEIVSEDLVRVEASESPYSASKLAGEALMHSYANCYGIKTVILRFSNVYGAYDQSNRVIPLFIDKARKNEPLVIFGKQKKLDFTYIDDTVTGIIQVLEKFDEVAGETFNIATGTSNTIVELAEYLKELLGSSSELVLQESRTGEIFHYTADISNARKKLGYDPKTSFKEGIQKTVEWYKENT